MDPENYPKGNTPQQDFIQTCIVILSLVAGVFLGPKFLSLSRKEILITEGPKFPDLTKQFRRSIDSLVLVVKFCAPMHEYSFGDEK